MRRRDEIAGRLIVLLSLVYLWTFVPRGWVPHDEGMLGQSAERVLAGQFPHVDFQETYTGGLALLHSVAFRIFGVDLLHLRWVLFAGAVVAQCLTYALLKRYVTPIGAAFASSLALTWSFPNYFASLPSWWVLICALTCLWAFVRYVETERVRYAALAGLTAGFAVLIKQTGVYVLVALMMSMLYGSHRLLSASAGMAALVFATTILSLKVGLSESLYLLVPIASCSVLLAAKVVQRPHVEWRKGLNAVAVTLACALALPFLAAVPYLRDGNLHALVEGLILLPQKRIQSASLAMAPAYFLVTGVPFAALALPVSHHKSLSPFWTRGAQIAMWLAAAMVLIASFYRYTPYQLIWQSVRAFAALLPVAVCWIVFAHESLDGGRRRILFAASAILAWASLVQFPFSAAIYFCYVVPLVVVAGAAAFAQNSTMRHPVVHIWSVVLLIFALLCMNRGYLVNLGAWHAPQSFDVDLGLPRARLRVSGDDAVMYRRVIELVEAHLGRGQLRAGPDCPEVFYLTGNFNPSGALFDFFTDTMSGWQDANVIVLNHAPGFAAAPSSELAGYIREEFPNGERVGRFEVRWR
jgi:hypothetical protein